ncbi:MAG: aminotransferase class V-fold PLP-dependent enzyme [Gammaproteobacteria bacterium]
MNQNTVEALDLADPLAKMRQEFLLPDNCIYLCGHSLGAFPKCSATQVNKMMLEQCGQMGVRAWNDADWINLPANLGNKIAKLIGAKNNEVTVTDSTSINLFKLLMAGLKLNPDRNIILTEADNFPTDLYIAQTVAELNLNVKLVRCHRSEIEHQINDKTAILFLSHVDYRTGELHDMQAMTDLAHQHGALMFYDVSHSVGIYPLTLSVSNVDMAVGCTYKYLNGGPGAPAFLYVAEQHQSAMNSPLTGWMGHHSPFDFSADYIPALDV